jgi:transglutaminase-like putative cysteine protease/predicted glutamine amidotransferase
MPSFLAMSFEGALSPSFDLRCLSPGRSLPDGWGIGFYPGHEPAATILKEPSPAIGSVKSQLVESWEHLESSLVLMHIRAARWGSIEEANTQPFLRTWGKRDWLFIHSGSLETRPVLGSDPLFEPVGSTDTELVFCDLMSKLATERVRRLRDLDPRLLQRWMTPLNELGVLTCALTDGTDLAIYTDTHGHQPSLLWELKPPYDEVVFGDDEISVNLTKRGAKSRKGVIVSSNILESDGDGPATWRELSPGSLLIVRQGAILSELAPQKASPLVKPAASKEAPKPGTVSPEAAPKTATSAPVEARARPRTAPPRRLEIRHRTVYRYDKPVERSVHLLRFEPVTDLLQRLARHDLRLSVDGKWRDYSDVFGNRARRVLIESPYTELAIESHALVVTLDTDPFELRPLHAKTTIPLNWMPWQRHMLQPYLLPPELPETQLIELHEYAMSFVERNDYDLVESLVDMNQTIFRDYKYKQNSTTVFTTPFDVYANRRGVCQDFTNLFICLARLLNIPARYVCGYLYTGPKHHNRAMAEATHAWAQVYLPETGWRGFDPTNGVLTQTDHVRVAVGRNYMDATPTSGTIFVGGGHETLEVAVSCEEVG